MSQLNPVDVLTPSFIKEALLRSFRKAVTKSGSSVRHLFLPSVRMEELGSR
jgi:hypothetical protein